MMLRRATGLSFGLLCLIAQAHAAVIVPANATTIKKAIAARRGHVVLVNFWATWCGPCVAEFPDLVRVSRTLKKQGLETLAVTADSRKDLTTKVRPFILKSGAAFPIYLEQSADPQDFITAFDPSWQGDLPRTFIYDRRGKLVRVLSGQQTAQSLTAAVRPYLKP
jgi:thiol-disulfide isomerase/thioredoxin